MFGSLLGNRHAVACWLAIVAIVAGPVGAEEMTITGQVLGPDGQGAADCRVLLRYFELERGSIASSHAMSDPGGRFSFTVQLTDTTLPVWVAAHRPGLAVDWATVRPGGKVTLRLGTNPATCAGLVTDPEGNPVTGARVSVRMLAPPYTGGDFRKCLLLEEDPFLSDTTDEEGRFEIAGLPADQRVYLTAIAEGRGRLMLCDSVCADSRDSRLVLCPEATIAGRVTYNGQPLGGVEVFCVFHHGYGYGSLWLHSGIVSANDGSYQLEGLPAGHYIVMVEAPEGLTAPAIEDVVLEQGEHQIGADFELAAGGLVKGTVTIADSGQPAAGAQIFAYGPGRPTASSVLAIVTTDEAGSYTLRLPGGTSRVHYHGGVGNITFARAHPIGQQVEVIEGETSTGVDFVLRRNPRLRGQVLLPDGEPAAGAELGVVSQSFFTPLDALFSFTTDAAGNFEVEPRVGSQEPFVWRLVVVTRDVGLGLASVAFLTKPEDAARPLEIGLQEGVYVITRVIDADDKPVPDIFVKVRVLFNHHEGVDIQEAPSDKEGYIRIGPLPPGVPLAILPTYDTREQMADLAWLGAANVTLRPGEKRELPPLRLNLQRSVKGWVGDDQQRSVPGAVIFASGHAGMAYADDDGLFELTGLPAQGTVRIVAVHPAQPLFGVTELDPDWGFEPGLILKPLGSVTGRIADEQEQPISGYRATLRDGAPYIVSEELRRRLNQFGFRWNIATDDEGRWSLSGLIPGADYRVGVYPPKSWSVYTYAEFTAEAGQTVDLGEMAPRKDPEAGGPGI